MPAKNVPYVVVFESPIKIRVSAPDADRAIARARRLLVGGDILQVARVAPEPWSSEV